MNVNAAEFKAKCRKLLDEVTATHQPLVITERGRPAARVVPIDDATARSGGYTLVARDRNSRLRQDRARERAGCLRRGQPGMDPLRDHPRKRLKFGHRSRLVSITIMWKNLQDLAIRIQRLDRNGNGRG